MVERFRNTEPIVRPRTFRCRIESARDCGVWVLVGSVLCSVLKMAANVFRPRCDRTVVLRKEVKGFYHGGHRGSLGSQRFTGVHRGNRRLKNALHLVRSARSEE